MTLLQRGPSTPVQAVGAGRGGEPRADPGCLAACEGGRVTDLVEALVHYLQGARDAVLWKLDGLSETTCAGR